MSSITGHCLSLQHIYHHKLCIKILSAELKVGRVDTSQDFFRCRNGMGSKAETGAWKSIPPLHTGTL